MKTLNSINLNSPVKLASISGWMTMITGFGILLIGIREFFYPSAVALGFGVPLLDPRDGDLLAIKAARDVAHAAWTFTPAILIHWGTAAFMIAIVGLLRNGK